LVRGGGGGAVASRSLLGQGIDIAAISLVLGHSGPGITGKIYAHLSDGTRATAAAAMNGVLRPAAESGSGSR
jgi:integrase